MMAIYLLSYYEVTLRSPAGRRYGVFPPCQVSEIQPGMNPARRWCCRPEILNPVAVGEGDFGADECAVTRYRFDAKATTDHLHTFAHAEQSQAFFLLAS